MTVAPESGVGAVAVQISDVPARELARRTSVHGTPPPETVSVCAAVSSYSVFDSRPSGTATFTSDDADLMFDGSAGWDYVTAMWFGRVLEECGFLWYEEPMREFELGSYRKLCDALDIPVLAAETPDGCHWNMATWIQLGALDMTRTSWFFKGGITGATTGAD